MSFQFKVTVNGFNFMFGNDLHNNIGLFLNFSDPAIIHSIMHREKNFYDALMRAMEESELWESQYLMEVFEHYYLQHGYEALQDDYSFESLTNFKNKAELILSHEDSSDYQRKVAQRIVDTLQGRPPRSVRPEKSPEEKAKNKFNNAKPALRLKVTIRDGYKCELCGCDNPGLALVKKDKNNDSYELDNLILRCRKCAKK